MKSHTVLTFLPHVLLIFLPGALALPIIAERDQTTLLTVLSQQPNLSIFSFMIQQTGGTRPNPAFEERFNSALDTRNFTDFIPSNGAMLALPQSTLDLLARPQSYPLLESLIKIHIAEGLFKSSDIESTSSPPQINSIEGFPLTLSSSTNNGDQNTAGQFKLDNATLSLTDIPASNGRIHTLDRMLNPYSDYLGISNSSSAPASGSTSSENTNETTMADILTIEPSLSTLHEALLTIDPSFLTRLSLSKSLSSSQNTLQTQIFLAPSNSAFASVPLSSWTAPSNVALSSYLLRGGMLTGDMGVLNMMLEGSVQSMQGWNVTVRKTGDVWRVGNAAVERRDVCVGNGCVWIIDKVLDPLFGEMG